MKRLFYTLAVLVLLICAIVTMNACGDAEVTTTEAVTTAPITTEAPIPEGYTEYSDGSVAFAYPENFQKQDGSTVIIQDVTTGNNITVVYEAKNPYYATLDLATYNSEMKPAFESMGLTITNPSVKQTKNDAGVAITKISHTATASGVSMKQTMLITTIGNRTYTVTVTEVKSDSTLVNNVFNTLKAAK